MIDKRERFGFWIRESPTNKTLTSTIITQTFFSKEGTEEHNFQEAFDHCRVKVFFA